MVGTSQAAKPCQTQATRRKCWRWTWPFKREAALDLGDHVGRALEGVVDVVAGLKVAGFVGELAAAELGDLVELGAFGFDFLGNGSDEFVDGAFEGLGVKDDQALVFATHRFAGSGLLRV